MTSDVSDPLPALLPQYEVGEELGRGGFGVVRAGRHLQLDRAVAIKELPAFLADDPVVRARFVAEARVLAALAHPHIVPIYDYVERDGVCVLVMEQLPGGTVWHHFTRGGFAVATACAVAMAAADGLHYAHEHGVLHRDMKPENLLFSADGVLKVTDFGIAQVIGGDETLATEAGEIVGTPAYMAPEQAQGLELGPAADIYATGVMLYELLSGRLPFSEEGGALSIVYRHCYEEPVPLQEVAPQVPPVIAAMTMQALARNPDDRFKSCEAFGVALGQAATALWGPGWLDQAEVSLMAPGPILASAQRPSAEMGAHASPAEGRSRGDARPGAVAEPRAIRVRPSLAVHVGGAGVSELPVGGFVPVRKVIDTPPSPVLPGLLALALLGAAVVLPLVGSSPPERVETLGAGTATVAGTDVADPLDDAEAVDLTAPIEIRLRQLPPGAATADAAQLGFSIAGVTLPASSREELVAVNDGLGASVNASASRYLLGGEVTGELRLFAGDEVVLRHEFPLDRSSRNLLTLPGVLAVVVAFFLAGYFEALLRQLRRGRRVRSRVLSLTVLGACAGVLAVVAAWLAGSAEPTLTTAALGAVPGAAGAAALGITVARRGRRRRGRQVRSGSSRPPGPRLAGSPSTPGP